MAQPHSMKFGGLVLDQPGPYVVVGPNGSGKTRIAAQAARQSGVTMIKALRDLAVPAKVNPRPVDEAEHAFQNKNHRSREPWKPATDVDVLFAKLVVDYLAAAAEHFELDAEGRTDPNASDHPRNETILWRIQSLFAELFPRRKVVFNAFGSKAVREPDAVGKDDREYAVEQMSDGERTALYLSGKILSAGPGTILVDEPESHFHSLLAVRFWDRLETMRSDCRFVYITHDLSFALSRACTSFIAVYPGEEPRWEALEDGASPELAQALLSAAGFRRHVRRIVLCEGNKPASIDRKLYSAWFRDRETEVVPVGSCEEVERATRTLQKMPIFTELEVLGVVDRDFRSDEDWDAREHVHALPYKEAESLLSLRSVYLAVARSIGVEDGESRYEACVAKWLGNEETKKQAIKVGYLRYRSRCEFEFKRGLGDKQAPEFFRQDPTDARPGTIDIDIDQWPISPLEIAEEERRRAWAALDDIESAIRILPGKSLLPALAQSLEVRWLRYVGIICHALRGDTPLARELEECLAHALPPRRPTERSRS